MMRREPERLDARRWTALMQRLTLAPNAETLERLQAAYAEPHRHYHTGEHVNHCLAVLDAARSTAERPDEVELALWFHDAVYSTRARNNEAMSAHWARAFLTANGVDPACTERVQELIMATAHAVPVHVPDAMLVVDVDLAILAADREAYARFEENVRKEYSWVPGPLFRRTRASILQSFLDRPCVYSTARFRDRLERTARENLRAAIATLRG